MDKTVLELEPRTSRCWSLSLKSEFWLHDPGLHTDEGFESISKILIGKSLSHNFTHL